MSISDDNPVFAPPETHPQLRSASALGEAIFEENTVEAELNLQQVHDREESRPSNKYPSRAVAGFRGGAFDTTAQQLDEPLSSEPIIWSSTNMIQSDPTDFSNFLLYGGEFLEDAFLRQITYSSSGLTIPPTPIVSSATIANATDLQDTTHQLATPESSIGARHKGTTSNVLHIAPEELDIFHAKLTASAVVGGQLHFRRPSLSRTLRCIIAYFRHFDPHCPIVHYASFKISETHRQWTQLF